MNCFYLTVKRLKCVKYALPAVDNFRQFFALIGERRMKIFRFVSCIRADFAASNKNGFYLFYFDPGSNPGTCLGTVFCELIRTLNLEHEGTCIPQTQGREGRYR
jgi:hypothetical protein